jgi:hypothetical protein
MAAYGKFRLSTGVLRTIVDNLRLSSGTLDTDIDDNLRESDASQTQIFFSGVIWADPVLGGVSDTIFVSSSSSRVFESNGDRVFISR